MKVTPSDLSFFYSSLHCVHTFIAHSSYIVIEMIRNVKKVRTRVGD